MTCLLDLFPTVCDLVGANIPGGLDCKSLKPVIEGKSAGVRDSLFLSYRDVQRAVAALPESLRDVFILKQVEGYRHNEIATLLGITEGASRVRLTRAVDALRRALVER